MASCAAGGFRIAWPLRRAPGRVLAIAAYGELPYSGFLRLASGFRPGLRRAMCGSPRDLGGLRRGERRVHRRRYRGLFGVLTTCRAADEGFRRRWVGSAFVMSGSRHQHCCGRNSPVRLHVKVRCGSNVSSFHHAVLALYCKLLEAAEFQRRGELQNYSSVLPKLPLVLQFIHVCMICMFLYKSPPRHPTDPYLFLLRSGMFFSVGNSLCMDWI